MASEKPDNDSSEAVDKQVTAPNYAPSDQKVDGKFTVVDEQQLERVVHRVLRAEEFSGPTPHPEHLERYEKTLQGAAKIIFDEYQANSQHQREMEKGMLALQNKKLEAASEGDRKSRNGAFFLVLAGFAIIALCVVFKATVLGVAVAGTLLVAVLRSYLPKAWLKSSDKSPQQPKTGEPSDTEED